ncbi:MAG: BACON domain-containing protein [Prevotellaceae bacterium]|jgi:hypothetical protein|nr:BACON domain-containing protein [Prevotellaceae bacterium]
MKTNKITKKSLWLMTALCLLMVACEEKEERTVTVSPETLSLPGEGGADTVIVTSTVNWKVNLAGSDWLAAFPMKGGPGATKVAVMADPLPENGEREARVRILLEDNTEAATVQVSQAVVYSEKPVYLLSAGTVELSDKGNMRLIRLASDNWWELKPSNTWIHLNKDNGPAGTYYIKVSADENTATADRTGSIDLIIGEKQTSIVVTQGKPGDYYNNGDVVTLNTHSKGTGYPVVVVGDGFDRQDLKKGGWWEFFAREIAEYFHNTDLIYDLWDYFDVHILMSESEERGVNYPDNSLTGSKKVTYTRTRTKFGAHGYMDGERTWDAITAARAAVRSKGGNNVNETRVIFMTNGPYPGNATNPLARMGIDEQSYAYWAVHEFAAHIVSNVPDLYCYSNVWDQSQINLQDSWNDIDAHHARGEAWYVDHRNDPAQVVWKDFIGKPGYNSNRTDLHSDSDSIGVFPTGCCQFPHNNQIWRPNKLDAMEQWYLCHGLGTRYQMWNIVMKVADETANENNIDAFKTVDTQRQRFDCAYKTSPYKWSDYNVSGKKTKSGDYDRFWEALWPRSN